MNRMILKIGVLFAFSFWTSSVFPLIVRDDFTQRANTTGWISLGYACLTARSSFLYDDNNNAVMINGLAVRDTTPSTIPKCEGLTTPDPPGKGALRLTPAEPKRRGAIISNFVFPNDEGIDITFTTYTYAYGGGRMGGDGISFFLIDGSVGTTFDDSILGQVGGSISYSCSNNNVPYKGLNGAYLGLGIDEFGNFLNSIDNTSTGIPKTTSNQGNGHNSLGRNGDQEQSNRIGLRGAGNINWDWLHQSNPEGYPSAMSDAQKIVAVKSACTSGFFSDFKTACGQDSCDNAKVFTIAYATKSIATNTPIQWNYNAIPGGFWVLPDNQLIASQGSTRKLANPINYRLSITRDGLLSFDYSYNNGAFQPVLSRFPITTGNGPLPATFRFGFASSTGEAYNIHEISCFSAEPIKSNSNSGVNAVQSGQVRTGTQVYLASYNPNDWSGSLVSTPIVTTNGVVSVSSVAQWDANCVLTGGGCWSMGTSANGTPINTISAQNPNQRNILTWNGVAGIPFQWTNLTSAQQGVLNASGSAGASRLGWLRGVRTQEQDRSSGTFRTRSAGVLGDIIGSSPTWVGPPSKSYPATFRDFLRHTNGTESSYLLFKDSLATRAHVVYVGSNDGILHGFRSGSNNAVGVYDSATNNGHEVLGYVPSSVLSDNRVVDLTSPTYAHHFFVDAAPGVGDVYYNNEWHTWLVGGIGNGGAEIYALDVTDPTGVAFSNRSFSESNASRLVMGDWTSASLTAATCVHASTGCGNNLGKTYGTPLIRRLHNERWAIIFGNGINSSNGNAGVYIGLITDSGGVNFYWLDTGVGGNNGITHVSSADLDGDFVTDYLYAGDLQGNVWRFDLTDSNPNNWAVSQFGQPSATPLFVARDSLGNTQPITTSIAVSATMGNNARRLMLGFGTGRATSFSTSSATTYQAGTQSVYGIWDWNMTSWNSLSSSQYAALPVESSTPYRTFTRTNLFTNTVASQTLTQRTATIATVCWNDSNVCPSGNNQYGWKFDLPESTEQVIYNPLLLNGMLLVNTVVAPVSSAGQCNAPLPTGWSMAFDMSSGGGKPQNVFPDQNGNLIVASGAASIVGLKQGAVGTPYIVTVNNKQYAISSTVGGGAPSINELNTPQTGGSTAKRISWEQVR